MSQPRKPKKTASPYSVGGGGPNFEDYVGAYYLAFLLRLSAPPGQGTAAIPQEIQFQSLYRGEPVDDLKVLSRLPQGNTRLALQIKHDLTIGEKDDLFDEVLFACWQSFRSSSFVRGFDHFGIVLGHFKAIHKHYKNALAAAKTSTNGTDFLLRVSQKGSSHQAQDNFVKMIREKLDTYETSSVSDDILWQFLSSMELLHFDLQQNSSHDQAAIIDLLRHTLPPEQQIEAPRLFQQLVAYAAEANRTAGSFNWRTLTERLIEDGFALLPTPDCQRDLDRLQNHAKAILNDIREDIGGFVLDRTTMLTTIQKHIQENTFLELVGEPGVGKSVFLKALAEQQKSGTLVLAGDRIQGVGWDGFAQQLQLTQPLHDLLLALSGFSSPCIFIDGVDNIIESGARKAVNDILHQITQLSFVRTTSKSWRVIITVREDNLEEVYCWLAWPDRGQAKRIHIDELSDEEIQSIAEQRPHLSPLLSLSHLHSTVRKPLLLRVLDDRRMRTQSGAFPPVATEIEVSEAWWEQIVGLMGTDPVLGRVRQQTLLTIGKRCILSPWRWIPCEDVDANALYRLEADSILLRDRKRDVYRLSHDVFQEWIFLRVLNQHREELPKYLQSIHEPLGLQRALQLLGTSLLEHQMETTWIQLLQQIEKTPELSPRWRQSLLLAPIRTAQARELLHQVRPFLLENNARRLIDLFILMRTVEVFPDINLLPIAQQLYSESRDHLSLLLNRPIPNMRTWIPFLGWFLEQPDSWALEVRLEMAQLMELWLQHSPDHAIYRQEIGKRAFQWLKELEEVKDNDEL